MTITGIDLKNLRNDEYFQFMKNTVSLVNANDPVVLNVVTQNNALNTKLTEFDALFKKSTASDLTQEITNLDARRDNALVGINSVINGYLYHFTPGLVQAANKLNDNLKLYGTKIISQNYQAETATITSLVGDWQAKPELTNAVNALNLNEWVAELTEANTLFDTQYLARTQEYGDASPENILSKRNETNASYYDLKSFLESFSVVQPSSANTTTINQLNALIEQYNTLLSNRAAGGESDTPTPTT
jgi:hypothetical protein